MNGNARTIGIIVFLIMSLIGVMAVVNRNELMEQQRRKNEAVFAVLQNGEELKNYDLNAVMALGETDFSANLKSDGENAIEHRYTGVLLGVILEDAGVDLDSMTSASVSSVDGKVVAVSKEKLLENANVYLAYKRDGEWIGTRDEGGDGPYQMIIRNDKFSQNWCEYTEVKLGSDNE